jgi:hypothetical protein
MQGKLENKINKWQKKSLEKKHLNISCNKTVVLRSRKHPTNKIEQYFEEIGIVNFVKCKHQRKIIERFFYKSIRDSVLIGGADTWMWVKRDVRW